MLETWSAAPAASPQSRPRLRPARRHPPARSRPRPSATPDAVAALVFGAERLTYRELERAGEPAGPATCRPWASGPRRLVGDRHVAIARRWSWAARRPQGRRGLRAARPRLPAGAARAPCWTSRGSASLLTQDHRCATDWPAVRAVGGPPRRPRLRRRSDRDDARTRRQRSAAGGPGLRDLHLGLDRRAQGRDGRSTASLVDDDLRWERRYSSSRPGDRHLQARGARLRRRSPSDWFPAWTTGGRSSSCPRERRCSIRRSCSAAGCAKRAGLDLPSSLLVAWVDRGLASELERTGESLRLLRLLVGRLGHAPERLLQRLLRPGGTGPACDQFLRPDRGDDRQHLLRGAEHRPAAGARPELRRSAGRSADTRVYVLDAQLEPVPVGVAGRAVHRRRRAWPGAICGRPGADGGAVRPRPVRRRPGGRLYRTGDRGRWRPDGDLELLGRRRPPGEDPRLPRRAGRGRGGPAAPSRRARGRGRGREDTRATSGWWPTSCRGRGRTWTSPSSAAGCRQTLPELHGPLGVRAAGGPAALGRRQGRSRARCPTPVPAPLDPAPSTSRPALRSRRRSPGSGPRCSELERVGVHDNFFDLGGHSLQSVQLVSRLTAALNRPVSVKTVFQAPTVAAMAEVLEREPAGPLDRTRGDDAAALARWLLETEPAALPEHVTIEEPARSSRSSPPASSRRSIRSRSATSPRRCCSSRASTAATVIHDWCGNRPLIAGVRETPAGPDRHGHDPPVRRPALPGPGRPPAVLGDAVRLARQIGATTVSLTGLLPSATDYGRDLAEALAGQDLPRITTGHATTTAAVVLAVRRALEEGGRDARRRARRLHRPGVGRRRDAPALALVPAASRRAQPLRRLFEAGGPRGAAARAGRRARAIAARCGCSRRGTRCRRSSTRRA